MTRKSILSLYFNSKDGYKNFSHFQFTLCQQIGSMDCKWSSFLIDTQFEPIQPILQIPLWILLPIPHLLFYIRQVRASPAVLSMWSCTSELDEEKSKLCRFSSGKWFWLRVLAQFAVAGTRHRSNDVHMWKIASVTNMICFWLAYHNDWSMWFAISNSPHLFAILVSVSWVG